MQLVASKTFYQSHAITIMYDKKLRFGHAVWRGNLTSHDLREATLLCMHAIEKYELKYWLGDNRKMKGIRQEDQIWVKENVVPVIAMGPLEKMATLVSEDLQNAEAVHLMYEGIDEAGYILMMDFNKEEEAFNWLLGSK